MVPCDFASVSEERMVGISVWVTPLNSARIIEAPIKRSIDREIYINTNDVAVNTRPEANAFFIPSFFVIYPTK